MRVNVVQMGNGSAIVLVISQDEALAILGLEGDIDGTMVKLRNLLESALEEIGAEIEVESGSDN
jgi:hypothetical protein